MIARVSGILSQAFSHFRGRFYSSFRALYVLKESTTGFVVRFLAPQNGKKKQKEAQVETNKKRRDGERHVRGRKAMGLDRTCHLEKKDKRHFSELDTGKGHIVIELIGGLSFFFFCNSRWLGRCACTCLRRRPRCRRTNERANWRMIRK